jgi:CheY-like chemotaxis protein
MNKRRILLVDDEPAFTRVIRNYLETTNRFEVRMVNRPEDALAAAREFQPELVLLDVIMPDMDGGELAGTLQNDPHCRSIKHIVFLTAIVSKDDVTRPGALIGGRPFLVKPVDMNTLIEFVDMLLTKAA